MLWEKLKKAWDTADVDAYKALHHIEYISPSVLQAG